MPLSKCIFSDTRILHCQPGLFIIETLHAAFPESETLISPSRTFTFFQGVNLVFEIDEFAGSAEATYDFILEDELTMEFLEFVIASPVPEPLKLLFLEKYV